LGRLVELTDGFDLSSNLLCGDLPLEVSALSTHYNVSNYDVYSNNSLGTPCCETLSAVYTCVPTMVPILRPTPLPTILPTIVPTVIPTPIPTPSPTPLPTSLPTINPTPAPTLLPFPVPSSAPTPIPIPSPSQLPTYLPTGSHSPTSLPSNHPSVLPTLVPTVRCEAGTYFDQSICVDCPIGRFSSNNVTNIPLCNLCAVGKYNTKTK